MTRWQTAMKGVRGCAVCGDRRGLKLHHIVYRQHVRRAGGDEWDPRNALALCVPCHAAHHSRQRVLPVALLPPRALAFAAELLGAAAENYFARYYIDEAGRRGV
jgi:5-methylcytosine-specific restriction endonuclease McrA